MNVRKSIAIVTAILITAAGMSGIASYSNAGATATRNANASGAAVIATLPTVEVRPSAEQLQELNNVKAPATTPASAAVNARMPFYSFAADTAGA